MNNLKKYLLLMLSIVIVILIYSMQREVVPVNDGLGWDGIDYVAFMQGFCDKFFHKLIPQHYILRFGYLGWGNLMVYIFGTENIVFFSQITNIVLIISSLYFFEKICETLQFSEKQFVLGTILLFFNFATLKFSVYLPVLSDTFGFFFGLVSTYFYLEKKRICFLLSILVGVGFFPTVIFYFILIIFNKTSPTSWNFNLKLIRWLPMIGFATLLSILLLVFGDRFLKMQTSQVTKISTQWLFFAIPFVLYYLWIISALITNIYLIKHFFKTLNIKALTLFVLTLLTLKIIQFYFGNNDVVILSGTKFVLNIVKHSIQVPGGFIIAHAMFFGVLPIFFFIRYWKTTQENFMLLPQGEKYFIYLILLLVLNSESRQLINLYPFLLVYLLKSIERVKLRWFEIFFFSIISIVQSGFWYQINTYNPLQFEGSLQKMEAQRFFRFIGPWVSEWAYLENLVLVFALLLLFLLINLKIVKPNNLLFKE